jgi:phytoene dehydrogenase-like protein
MPPARSPGTDWDEVREAFADRIEAILPATSRAFDKLVLARRAYSPAKTLSG